MKRRDFLQTTGTAAAGFMAGGAMLERPAHALSGGGYTIKDGLEMFERGSEKNIKPKIRPEIESNPNAVFIIETHVDASADSRGMFSEARPQLYESGSYIAKHLFVAGDERGGGTAVKPNYTDVPEEVHSPVVGVIVSPDFVSGFVHGLYDIGNTNVIPIERGAWIENHRATGIYEVMDEHGLKFIESAYPRFSDYDEDEELNWMRVPGDPVVWNRIPITRPLGDDDCLFVNLAKMKCHNLGLTTLTIKNLQGAVPSGYGHYCNTWWRMKGLVEHSYLIDWDDFEDHYFEKVEQGFLKHREMGYKHWDYENYYPEYQSRGGWEAFEKIKDEPLEVRQEFMDGIEKLMWDEQWCQRAIDSASAITPDINVIEGVIARSGSGFAVGEDKLANIVVAGKSMTEVDAVGSWIMGQDPRELFYTRIANERGLGENDIEKIDIYLIRDDNRIEPVRDIAELPRHNLGVNLHSKSDTGERLFW